MKKVYGKEECLVYYQRKYAFMEYEDIELLYDIAEDIFLNILYPFEYDIADNIIELEHKKHPTWHLRCMQEVIDKQGISNVVGYSENGVSVTFDKTGLSQSLIDELTTKASII